MFLNFKDTIVIKTANEKRRCWIIVGLVIALIQGGCGKFTDQNKPYVFTTPGKHREMIRMNGDTVTGSGSAGVFIAGKTTTLTSYQIAKYETTWELWDEVAAWAKKHGYTLTSDSGYQGHQVVGAFPEVGTANESHGWTKEQKTIRPVTYISWQDAIVWCNAYSETSGLEPVYTAGDGKTVLKNATNSMACDGAVIKTGANGYRLPTEAQWEYAARGGNPEDTINWNYIYAGTSATGTEAGQLGDYAWYNMNSYNVGVDDKNYGAHPVGTGAANSAGLYDMSGNVWEWCWNKYDSVDMGFGTDPAGPEAGVFRIVRGGNWTFSAAFCAVSYRYYNYPSGKLNALGFRVVLP
jgi:formylglycine-generating enzyme required for sulfatase activity